MAVSLAFVAKPLMLPIDRILPSKIWPDAVFETKKFKLILASIQEVDLIEPLSVGPVDRKTGHHLLLDGHLRLLVLKQLQRIEVPCLVATDDESYTYNNRVNRLSTIQEHYMIRRALERGVPPERLASALCVDSAQLMRKANLLNGICAEAAELLKDRQFSPEVSTALRQMRPTRQIECVELMIAANTLTVPYARALLMATPSEMLTAGRRRPVDKAVSQEQVERMEHEMANLQDQYKLAEQTYGEDILNLVVARGYIGKLIDNPQVMRYLQKHHEEVLEQFQTIVQSVSMEG
ncbi:plasmid partitioning protein RepB C-terminal domain-containing protein [Variovorax defluvii]|uniref:plasmid partitioning protein RepB C-terminal domain-containing protein n=1 Tax=Variovorax defluvii TaxID=913761 RepID=UPI0031F120F3